MKLWRLLNGVQLKTFALELIINRAMRGRPQNDYGRSVVTVLEYMRYNINRVRLEDPANTNNEVDMSVGERAAVWRAAVDSLGTHWERVIW